MELLQLHYFRETARLQHMSKAAEALHIAQPSLSQTIRRLEDELGTQLFDRKGRNICLNQAGSIFLKYVSQVFSALENASLELAELQSLEIQQISLCIQSASALLPDLLGLLKRHMPALQIRIFQNASELPLEQMDFVISSTWKEPAKPHTRILLKEPLLVALPAQHPLASRESLTISDLSNLDFISLGTDSNLSQIIDHYCRSYDFVPGIATYVDNPGIMRELLRANLGAAFIPSITWKDFPDSRVILKSLKGCPMQRYLTLTVNPVRYRTAVAESCYQLLCSYFSALSRQHASQQPDASAGPSDFPAVNATAHRLSQRSQEG